MVFLWIPKTSIVQTHKNKNTHQENASGGQIGNWIINYKEPRLSSAVKEKRDEVESRKEKKEQLY